MKQGLKVQKKVIGLIVMPNFTLMNIAGPSDVFSRASSIIKELTGKDAYEIVPISPYTSVNSVTSFAGITFSIPNNYKNVKSKIDTLLLCGGFPDNHQPEKEFLVWLKKMSTKVRRIGSICKGAFVLADAGLLKNKKANTHWKFCDTLQACYPNIDVQSDTFFVKDGNVYTSGGVNSGSDLSLALVEEDYGKEIALKVARMLVLFLKRPGNQLQFSELTTDSEHAQGPVSIALKWIASHIKDDLTVEQLAEKCSMSPRNFARVFLKETKMTPGKYIEKLRLETARKQLENTNQSLDNIAAKCGLGSPDTMRRLFLRHLKTTPSQYRNSFKTSL